MKNWLKGGLISGGISLIYYIIFVIIDGLTSSRSKINSLNETIGGFVTYPINFLNIPLHISISYGVLLSVLYQAVVLSLFYFIIGVIVILIKQKIKK